MRVVKPKCMCGKTMDRGATFCSQKCLEDMFPQYRSVPQVELKDETLAPPQAPAGRVDEHGIVYDDETNEYSLTFRMTIRLTNEQPQSLVEVAEQIEQSPDVIPFDLLRPYFPAPTEDEEEEKGDD